jgi:hypothetical protein
VTMGYCGWCVRSLQNGVHMRLLPSTKMGSLRFFYQVPKWGPYASSTKYQKGVHTLLIPSTKMGSIRFFYKVPKWGPYASSTKRQSGVPTLLPSTKMGARRFLYQVPKWGPYVSSLHWQTVSHHSKPAAAVSSSLTKQTPSPVRKVCSRSVGQPTVRSSGPAVLETFRLLGLEDQEISMLRNVGRCSYNVATSRERRLSYCEELGSTFALI